MRRWGHTHSAAAGLVGGLLLMRNGWLVLAAVLLAAVAGWWAHALRAQLGSGIRAGGSLLAARVATEHERARRVRAGARLAYERARMSGAERQRRENEAYWRGVADGTPTQMRARSGRSGA